MENITQAGVMTVTDEVADETDHPGDFLFETRTEENDFYKFANLVFNRPFIFEVRELSTNAILFIGAIKNL